MLEFFFAGDGVVDVLEPLAVDEPGDLVAGGERARDLLAVFHDAFAEVICHADLENVRAVGEDVDPEVVLVFWLHSVPPDVGAGETQIPFGNDKQNSRLIF